MWGGWGLGGCGGGRLARLDLVVWAGEAVSGGVEVPGNAHTGWVGRQAFR